MKWGCGLCPTADSSLRSLRRRWHILGQVQGVGFRPFVYRLAHRLKLGGYVLNDDRGVTVEAQGSAAQLKRFSRALDDERPPLALIDRVLIEDIPPDPHTTASTFQILQSDTSRHDDQSPARTAVTVDAALCDACLAELQDSRDRRHHYALINCTDCGPRYTLIDRVPYDRPNTTMRDFVMCPACQTEYTDPTDRRYHAQPIACHDCGPVLELVDPRGAPLPGDPITSAAAMLSGAKIIAVKGLGGFHLAVRADDQQAVSRLRRAKHRDAKPFAVMCRSLEAAQLLVNLTEQAQSQLTSPAAPIVLGSRRADTSIAVAVAPDSHRLGVMLPYTPIHHLLFTQIDPSIDALVMTSANPSDEPLTIDNDEAVSKLGKLCDAILWHDRPIRRRVDDSVVLDRGGDINPLPIRRARGYVPTSLHLPVGGDQPGLCIGGELKNTIALVRDGGAVLSQHLGDLSYTPVYDYFKETVGDLLELFDVKPNWIAHDLHPRYLASVHAKHLAKSMHLPTIGIQHHHAHAAAVLAEHHETGPALALVCDGVGFGADGTSWGGELLLADLTSFKRLARLRPLTVPGGDAAAYDTRRSGLALLHQAFGDDFADHPAAALLIKDPNERQLFANMMARNINCATSSAAGRYFDGIAALLGLSTHNDYEAQAAIRLESSAFACHKPTPSGSRFHNFPGVPGTIDLSPLIRAIVAGRAQGMSVESLAALFHDQLAWALTDAVENASRRLGITTVALSGGVFCNQRLTDCIAGRLSGDGLRVLTHEHVPANDGGLAFGQAAIAAAQFHAGVHRKAGV